MPSRRPKRTDPSIPARDRIGREAARLFHDGSADTIGHAVSMAAESLGLQDGDRPSHGRVRQHLQALSMQSEGEAGYRAFVRSILSAAEQLMTAITEVLPDVEPVLVGRVARGQVDGPTDMHVRLYGEVPIDELAATLVELGYDEPVFETVNTRHGRLNRILIDDETIPMVLTRCASALRPQAGRNLFKDEPIPIATLTEVRAMLGEG